jgi:hypothetical protein
VHALLELAIWLQAGEDRAAYCGGQPSGFKNGLPEPITRSDVLRSFFSLAEYKPVIKLFAAATVGCQGTTNEFLRLFTSESTAKALPRTHAL